jgi:hypothetical protein
MENYIIVLYILIILYVLFLGLNVVINLYIELVYRGMNKLGKEWIPSQWFQSQHPRHGSRQRARKFRKL